MDKKRVTLWQVSRRPALVLTALGALLAATYALAHVPLGNANLAISLTIAALKATLVGLIFMRLAEPNALKRLAALAGPIWVFVLFLLLFGDYYTR